MTHRTLLFVPMLVAGCPDPAQDKPAAQVNEPASSTESERPAAPEAASGTSRIALSPSNTKIEFVGSKLTGSHRGSFAKFSGEIALGDKPENSSVRIEIDVASLATDSTKLDGHLRSDDFFAVEKHPKARFASTSISAGGDGTHTVTGRLELRGVTKEIRFPAAINILPGSVSVKAEFSINRQDFGVSYKGMPDDLIRDRVALSLTVDAKAGP